MVIRVATFNIRNGIADDGTDSWQFRRHLVVRAIRSVRAEVLGLQEVYWHQRDFLRAEMPEYEQFGEHRDGGRDEEASLILYRHEHISLLEGGNVWLSEAPDVPGSRSWGTGHARMASWARLKVRSEGARLALVNCHLDHRSATARLHAASALGGLCDRLGTVDPTVIVGDFNCEPGSDPYLRLTGAHALRDAERSGTGPTGTGGTYHAWRPRAAAQIPRIDWILLSGNTAAIRTGRSEYHEGHRFPSDHYAVWADLCI